MEKLTKPITETPSIGSDIFSIKNKEIIISCILGDDSSPKITKSLNNQGYKQFACLSGGVKGLNEYFGDNISFKSNLEYDTNYSTSSFKKIFQQTKMLPKDYYSGLDGKILFIITHKEFENLNNTLTEDRLFSLGVKKIYYFNESPNLETFIKNTYSK